MARVLLVDDNHDATDSCAHLLACWGHEVRVAYDGLSGLQQALEFKPEVILLDLGLPKLSGHDLARRIRQNETLTGVKIVAVTGYIGPEQAQQSKDAGCDSHLIKPLDLALLKTYLE